MTKINSYIDIQISGNTYHITQSSTKPRNLYNHTVSNLRKMDEILKNDFTYANPKGQDEYSKLPKKRLLRVLKNNAETLRKDYRTDTSKYNWLSKKIRRITHKRNKVDRLYQNIKNRVAVKCTSPEAFKLNADAMTEVFKKVDLPEIAAFSQLNKAGNQLAGKAIIARAQEFGYRGNNQAEATNHLRALFEALKQARQDFPEGVFSFVRMGGIHPEKTLRNFKTMTKGQIIDLFSNFFLFSSKYSSLRALFNIKNNGAAKGELGLNGNSALWRSMISGEKNLVELLLHFGVNPDIKDPNTKRSLLDVAMRKGFTDIAKLLVAYGAKADSSSLYSAVNYKNEEMTEFLLQKGADPMKADENGYVPLFQAVFTGSPNMVNLLLIENNVNQSHQGKTPLFYACAYRYDSLLLEVVETLLKKGANPNIGNGQATPLLLAVDRQNLELIKLLVDYEADLMKPDSGGNLPLHTAAFRGNLEAVKILLTDQTINAKNDAGYTPLTSCFKTPINFPFEVAEFLLANGANPNIPINEGLYPLHLAVGQDNVKLVKLLLDYKADPEIKFPGGRSPLEVAEQNNNLAMYKLLLSA